MAFIRASMGGSGELTSTTLWKNSDDTANQPAISSLPLLQSIANFKYIKVKWNRVQAASNHAESLISVEELRKCIGPPTFYWTAANIASANNSFVRYITYIDDTHLGVSLATRIGSSNTSQGYCIISEIVGLA